MDIAGNFLSLMLKSVFTVSLVNLNLKSSIDALTKGFPVNMMNLDLSNTLITEFPAALTELGYLKSM